MPLGLCDQVQRILPLAKKVADEIVSEETEILKELILRMFEVMPRVAKLSCDYVKHGRWSSPGFDNLTSPDDHSENDWWSRICRDDRRNRQRVNKGDRRFRPCNDF